MPGLFLSYRRTDARGWAGRLFDHLAARFGRARVFMDIEGGIPRGADFERTLADALAGCDALLALMGPDWLECRRSDGRRRLDVPDDWVRNEIAAALRRGIPVVPVLLGEMSFPETDRLPEDLRPLARRQWAELSDDRWAFDVGTLVADLVKLTPLRPLDDVAAASTGLHLLRELVAGVPAVAEAVSRSREVIENTYRQVGKLELYKTVHDELHVVEFECLRPMQAGGAAGRLRPFKVKFAGAVRRIQDALRGREMAPVLQRQVVDLLERAQEDFEAAVEGGGAQAREVLLADLELLLTRLSPSLDWGISEAASELSLDRLVDLLDAVRRELPSAPAGRGPELAPLVEGIDALHRLRDELAGRVDEHARVQSLDSKLRAVCVAGIRPDAVPSEWERIKKVRSRLPAPAFTPELAGAGEDLAASEAEVEGAVARADAAAALDLLREYFRVVSTVFRDVDAGLKEFSLRLGEVSQPLEMVLEMVRAPAP
jgi:hypothetical protein